MKYEAYFKEFCEKHGYEGEYKYNSETSEYDIIISKGTDHAGAFFEEEDYQALTMEKLKGTLEILHKGFKAAFKK